MDLETTWNPITEETGDGGPLVEGCPCITCTDYDRDYVNYVSRAEELTAVRLLVEHNLVFMERLMSGVREAISAGAFDRYAEAILAGMTPWEAG